MKYDLVTRAFLEEWRNGGDDLRFELAVTALDLLPRLVGGRQWRPGYHDDEAGETASIGRLAMVREVQQGVTIFVALLDKHGVYFQAGGAVADLMGVNPVISFAFGRPPEPVELLSFHRNCLPIAACQRCSSK